MTIVARLNILIKAALRLVGDQRSFGTQPHAADALHVAAIGESPLFELGFQFGFDLVTSLRKASGSRADVHMMCVLRLFLAFLFGDFTEFVEGHECIHLPIRSDICSGDILPATSPSNTTAGASPQEPTQRAMTSDTCLFSVVWPGLMCAAASTALSRAEDPLM